MNRPGTIVKRKKLTFHLPLAYVKKVLKNLEATNAPAEDIAEFKAHAATAIKKISANYDNYDVLMGQSMDGDAMYVTLVLYFITSHTDIS